MTPTAREGRTPQVGEVAPDPELLDAAGKPATIAALRGPLVVLFFPWPVDARGARFLRDYRDTTMLFEQAGARLIGVSTAEPATLAYLRTERGLGFPMFSDADATATALWGMGGQLGLFVLDRNHTVRLHALEDGAPASAILTFLRRGGARAGRSPARAIGMLGSLFARIRGVLRPNRASARAVR